MNNNQDIRYSVLLKSKEYKKELGKLLLEIKNKCKKAENEATVSSFFENSIYYFIKSFFSANFNVRIYRIVYQCKFWFSIHLKTQSNPFF